MKRILLIFSSIHENGNTKKALNEFILKKFNSETIFKTINIYKMNIEPCNGCLNCVKNCVCRIEDDFLKVASEIELSDAIVVASPIFFSNFPAKLKSLIDRTQVKFAEKIKFGKIVNNKKREGYFVVSSGSIVDEITVFAMKKTIKQFFDCFDIEPIAFHVKNCCDFKS